MSATPPLPISVAWVSDRLYRVLSDDGPFGQAVEVDGWDTALDAAWRQMFGSRPEAVRWVSEYTDRCGDEHAVVSFGDTTRVVARYGYGNFNVSYPAELLCTAEDRVSAMRAAIVLVLDRHVRRSRLGLPLLSSIVAAE